jgi:hypothetical protein
MVVISAGWRNRFGFPHPTVLKRYISRGCRLWRTDWNGAVLFRTDGSELTAEPFIVDDRLVMHTENLIQAKVNPATADKITGE